MRISFRTVGLVCALVLYLVAAPSWAKSRSMSAAQYQTLLESANQQLQTLDKKIPRDLRPILKSLNQDLSVKRDDGEVQTTKSNVWSKWSGLRVAFPKNATRAQVKELQLAVQGHLRELNQWTTKRNGAYFTAAKAGLIVRQLESSGQIRTGPPWWRTVIDNGLEWLANTWAAFIKWLSNIMPRRTAPVPSVPDASWLWPVFWSILVGLLLMAGYFAYRAFGGKLRWGREKKIDRPLDSEDAELLQLPPEELRSRADQFAAQGNFREALRHRFIALLLYLDGRGIWRYDVRRTNWEHIEALQRESQKRKDATRGALIEPLSDVTRRFDRVRYGGADCGQSDWLYFDNAVRGVENAASGRQVAEVAR